MWRALLLPTEPQPSPTPLVHSCTSVSGSPLRSETSELPPPLYHDRPYPRPSTPTGRDARSWKSDHDRPVSKTGRRFRRPFAGRASVTLFPPVPLGPPSAPVPRPAPPSLSAEPMRLPPARPRHG